MVTKWVLLRDGVWVVSFETSLLYLISLALPQGPGTQLKNSGPLPEDPCTPHGDPGTPPKHPGKPTYDLRLQTSEPKDAQTYNVIIIFKS